MAIKSGHKFHSEHGFNGSAGKDARPTIPGFKRGGMDHAEGARDHFGKSEGNVHYDSHGFASHKKGGCA